MATQQTNQINLDVNSAYIPFLTNQQLCNVLYGGSGSGKSVAIVQKLVLRLLQNQNEKFLVIRKYATSLQDSVIAEFKRCLDGMRIEYTENQHHRTITVKHSGSQLLFRGLDDEEKIKSISGITSVWIEESNELELSEFTQLTLRVCGNNFPSYKQFIVSFNPISKTNWLYTHFFENTPKDTYILKTTYKDNSHLDAAYIQTLNDLKATNENYYNIYALGNFGNANRGSEFYPSFSLASNTGTVTYAPTLPLWVSYDFNTAPYMSALIAQVSGNTLYVLAEVTMSSPRANTLDTTKEVLRRFEGHLAGCYYTGDPSGKSKDTRTEAGTNDYTIAAKVLEPWQAIDRVASQHPPVMMRGLYINQVFAGQRTSKVVIDESCVKLIEDLQTVKQNGDGTKLKKRVKDKQTGIIYEAGCHLADAFDYLICQVFASEFNVFRRGGTITGRYSNAINRAKYTI